MQQAKSTVTPAAPLRVCFGDWAALRKWSCIQLQSRTFSLFHSAVPSSYYVVWWSSKRIFRMMRWILAVVRWPMPKKWLECGKCFLFLAIKHVSVRSFIYNPFPLLLNTTNSPQMVAIMWKFPTSTMVSFRGCLVWTGVFRLFIYDVRNQKKPPLIVVDFSDSIPLKSH